MYNVAIKDENLSFRDMDFNFMVLKFYNLE